VLNGGFWPGAPFSRPGSLKHPDSRIAQPGKTVPVTDPPFTGHHLTGSNRRSWPAAPHNPMVRFRVLPNATAVAQVVNEIRKKGAEQPVEIMVVAGDWERWSGQGDGFGPETDLTADS